MSNELKDAVEELYSVFASYGLPENTDTCRCCHTEADELLLKSHPLRELGVEELDQYASDALLVWGDAALFKHFMPRIYEIMAFPVPRAFLIDPEILLSKLRHAKWLAWPATEQAAVRTFLHALWRSKLGDPPDDHQGEDIEEWLCGIAQAEDDLVPYLTDWASDTRMSSAEILSAFVLSTPVAVRSTNQRGGFWDKRDNQYQQLKRWVHSGGARGLLERAASRAAGGAKAEFEAALSLLSE